MGRNASHVKSILQLVYKLKIAMNLYNYFMTLSLSFDKKDPTK